MAAPDRGGTPRCEEGGNAGRANRLGSGRSCFTITGSTSPNCDSVAFVGANAATLTSFSDELSGAASCRLLDALG